MTRTFPGSNRKEISYLKARTFYVLHVLFVHLILSSSAFTAAAMLQFMFLNCTQVVRSYASMNDFNDLTPLNGQILIYSDTLDLELKCSKQDGFFPADVVFLASTNLMVFAILRQQTWMHADVKYILEQQAKKQSYCYPNKGEKRQKEKEKTEKKREKTKKENKLERMMKMEARLECLTIELLQVKY
ncbi:hypothetical protein QVD17_25326 [Tagetes erecta]|uniref:Uncharacterized protein n=1 Tax=Tagetes erecta TaxID=13708 RepID=A0AAD8KJK8_TARER|nr:hypothetical protein QVD17_25326 [Tagetes erecta]